MRKKEALMKICSIFREWSWNW